MSRTPANVHTGSTYTAADFGAPAEWFDYRHNLGGQEVGKVFVGAALGLTGMEVSFGVLPPGASIPFLHAHKQNEELYIVVSGEGEMQVDGQALALKPGTAVRVATTGLRCWRAGKEPLVYIVIQAKEGSLSQATRGDGIIPEQRVKW